MTHSRGDLLRALSKKLIQLSGNDMINKRLSGKGTGGIFNVCDEIPQFVLNRLMEGKKFKIVGMMEPDDYLLDENTPEFKKAFDRHMDDCGLSEEGLEEDEIRERKDQLRIHLGMTPAHELIPSGHQLELPKSSSSESELERHTDDKLQTDLSEENLKKCLIKMERERVRFEREKGLQTLYAAFGFLQWQNADEKDFTSPILLMRVNLEKGRGENSYKISASGDLETNQSLSYALLQETRALPPQAEDFVDENGGFDINQMFEAYENFIQKFDSWKVLNRISVGIFKSRGIPFSEILPEGYPEENVTAAEEMLVGRDEMATNSGLRDVDDSESRDLVPSFALNADSSQQVPFILSRPGDPHGGQVSDQVISSLDIVPTCLDAAGIRIPAALDGKPIVKSEEPRNLFWRFGETNSHAVRSGDWKLLHNGGRKNREPTEGIVNRENLLKGTRLFNLKNDPGESKDLSKDRPKVLKRLQELYGQWSSEIASQSLNLEK